MNAQNENRDSAFLQEKDASFANRHGFSKHKPAKPLYTIRDAEAALERFAGLPFGKSQPLDEMTVTLRHSGHILGAATLDCRWHEQRIVFSGDLGRYDDEVMLDPEPVPEADYLVVESTYGDRRHDPGHPQEALATIVNQTVGRGGTVVIPAFAVGRVQMLLYHIEKAMASGVMRRVPVFLDSPMATASAHCLPLLAGTEQSVAATKTFVTSVVASLALVAIGLVFADALDRDHVLLGVRTEHDNALGAATGDPDALDRAADQLAAIGDQHDQITLWLPRRADRAHGFQACRNAR